MLFFSIMITIEDPSNDNNENQCNDNNDLQKFCKLISTKWSGEKNAIQKENLLCYPHTPMQLLSLTFRGLK